MLRFAALCCLLIPFLCSVGCQMCCTPHDHRISGYVDRFDDYRGFNPMYRAGSIVSGHGYEACLGNACYVGNTGDYYNNAGNYGATTPVTPIHPGSSIFETGPEPGQHPIAVPRRAPQESDSVNGSTPGVPSAEDLRNMPRGTTPRPVPTLPLLQPQGLPPVIEEPPIQFSPSDEQPVLPPSTIPLPNMDTGLPITLEELRRLDPSVQDIQIISIEDAAVDTLMR